MIKEPSREILVVGQNQVFSLWSPPRLLLGTGKRAIITDFTDQRIATGKAICREIEAYDKVVKIVTSPC